MSKEIHAEQCYQIGKRPVEPRTKLQVAKKEHGDECCPNLDLHGIRTGSYEGLDLEVLLDPAKKRLDLPTLPIEVGHRQGWQVQQVGQKNIVLAVLVPVMHQAQGFRIVTLTVISAKPDELIG